MYIFISAYFPGAIVNMFNISNIIYVAVNNEIDLYTIMVQNIHLSIEFQNYS